jgi:hypothetical protein
MGFGALHAGHWIDAPAGLLLTGEAPLAGGALPDDGGLGAAGSTFWVSAIGGSDGGVNEKIGAEGPALGADACDLAGGVDGGGAGGSGETLPAVRAASGKEPGGSLSEAIGGCDEVRIAGSSTLGKPLGGVGATMRCIRSLRPQSWQNVRVSALLRPHTSQITDRGDRGASF